MQFLKGMFCYLHRFGVLRFIGAFRASGVCGDLAMTGIGFRLQQWVLKAVMNPRTPNCCPILPENLIWSAPIHRSF